MFSILNRIRAGLLTRALFSLLLALFLCGAWAPRVMGREKPYRIAEDANGDADGVAGIKITVTVNQVERRETHVVSLGGTRAVVGPPVPAKNATQHIQVWWLWFLFGR
jgi:hypothetical protein